MKDSPHSVWISYQGKPHFFAGTEQAQAFLDALPSRVGVEFVQAPPLFQLLNAPGAPLINWRDIINQVDAEFGHANTSEYRASLLQVFTSVMDFVEASLVDEDKKQEFRKSRSQHYKTFIVQESMIGDNICIETLHEVTGREIAADRMPPDHSLRGIAEQGMASPHFSREELLRGAAKETESRPST